MSDEDERASGGPCDDGTPCRWCVVLNYGTAAHAVEHLQGAGVDGAPAVLVVDNASPAEDRRELEAFAAAIGVPVHDAAGGAAETAASLRQGVTAGQRGFVLRSPINLGYAGGNNLGLRALVALCGEDLQAIVVNPDVRADRQALRALAEAAGDIVGPAVHEEYLDRVRDFEEDVDFALGFRARSRSGASVGPLLSGCCLKVSGAALARYGFLPEENFLYDEELYWFERVHRLGGEVQYRPDIVVHHTGSLSTGKSSFAYFYYIFRNRVNYYLRIGRVYYGGDCSFYPRLARWSLGVSRRLLRAGNFRGLRGVWLGIAHGIVGRRGRYEGAHVSRPAGGEG